MVNLGIFLTLKALGRIITKFLGVRLDKIQHLFIREDKYHKSLYKIYNFD